jgi:putative glutathione S-transferase
MPALWRYARDLYAIPAFGDNTDFEQIKQHYYVVHQDINPTGVVPAGPDPAVWQDMHGRR